MKKYICIVLVLLCFFCVSCGNEATNRESDGVLSDSTGGIYTESDVVGSENNQSVNDKNKEMPTGTDSTENNGSVKAYPIKLMRIDGRLYYDTGENSQMTPRCGTLDGNVNITYTEYEVPQKDGGANFEIGTNHLGFGWQNASDSTKEVPMEDGWRIFKQIKLDSILVYDFKSCMRVVGEDFEEIILSSKEARFDADGNAICGEKQTDERRIAIPVKYGQVFDWGVTMRAENVTSTGMTLVISQSGGNLKGELNTGTPYELSSWNGTFWERQPYREGVGDVAWNMPAFNIPTGSEREFEINWEWLYGELPSGKYRISKEIMDFKASADYDEHTYYLEFEIEDALCGYPTADSVCPYALMHDGVIYYYTGEKIFGDVVYTESDILGKVTSTVTETKMPAVDCQANIDILDSIFIKHELSGGGFLVLIDGEWYIFEKRDNDENQEFTDNDGVDSYIVGTADSWSVWELGATYGYEKNLGINYWTVESTSENQGVSTTKILPSEDGERYISFGFRKHRAKAGDFTDVVAFRVVSAGGKLVEVERVEAITKDVVLEKGAPYLGSLDGLYVCETRKGDDYDAHTITHKINVINDTIMASAYVRATDAGGKYEGSYTYDRESGDFCADLDYTVTSYGEAITTNHRISGKLLQYGGFVHFVLESAEPYVFSITTEDPFPLTFKIN